MIHGFIIIAAVQVSQSELLKSEQQWLLDPKKHTHVENYSFFDKKSRHENTLHKRLYRHCIRGDNECLKELLSDDNININQRSPSGITAIMYACLHGHSETVKLLLISGADPCIVTVSGKLSCLHISASVGDIKSVGYIYHKAEHLLLEKDLKGRLPLHPCHIPRRRNGRPYCAGYCKPRLS